MTQPVLTDDLNFDPRPDLSRDSVLWHHLLMHCRAVENTGAPRSLYGALHGLRCLGARLKITEGHIKVTAGEIDDDEYKALRDEWLVPHHAKLVEVLSTLEKWQ